MLITFESIVHHALTTRFVVLKPIYQDEKEESESFDNPAKGWPHIRPGFVFTPESVTYNDDLQDTGFVAHIQVPRKWVHFGWMESKSITNPHPDAVLAWEISCLDLVEKCDEAPSRH